MSNVVCVAEPGSIVNIRGSEGLPGKRQVCADVERVGLVMVEREEWSGWGEIREAPRDGQLSCGHLIGVGKMHLPAVGDPGRAQG